MSLQDIVVSKIANGKVTPKIDGDIFGLKFKALKRNISFDRLIKGTEHLYKRLTKNGYNVMISAGIKPNKYLRVYIHDFEKFENFSGTIKQRLRMFPPVCCGVEVEYLPINNVESWEDWMAFEEAEMERTMPQEDKKILDAINLTVSNRNCPSHW
jgi:hypothetical protein